MKKLFSILMIVVLLLSSFSFAVFAQENNTVYSLDNSVFLCLFSVKQGGVIG